MLGIIHLQFEGHMVKMCNFIKITVDYFSFIINVTAHALDLLERKYRVVHGFQVYVP